MLRSLNGGAIHVSIPSLEEGVRLCHLGGFDSLAMSPHLVNGKSDDEVRAILGSIQPGAWGVPFDWRGSEADHEAGLKKMAEVIGSMQSAGVTRCATWILPGSNDRNWDQNWAFHVRRLSPIARLLADHGMVFGLEFIGPKTLRDSFQHPFVYTMGEMIDLGRQIGLNVGLLLDAWHLHTSEGTLEELGLVEAKQIALVHVNDAPEGVPVGELVDNDRRLPGETAVIDIKGFLDTLRTIGYDGPVEAEPFDPRLKELETDEERVRKIGASLETIFGL